MHEAQQVRGKTLAAGRGNDSRSTDTAPLESPAGRYHRVPGAKVSSPDTGEGLGKETEGLRTSQMDILD